MQDTTVFILFSSFLFCSCTHQQCGYSPVQPSLSQARIIGGSTARDNYWPWIVSIRRMDITEPDFAFCGGSLINERYILTAAHCFSNINQTSLSNYFLVIGSYNLSDENAIHYKIKSIKIHENYDDNSYLNDIALVELSCQIKSSIGFICLPSKNIEKYPYESMKGVVLGWGSLEENGPISNTLQQIMLPILSNKDEYCTQQISNVSTQFCAGDLQGGRDACQGDSGGPLMIYDIDTHSWHIAGIISFGYGCARENSPGIYTRVSMFVDWIEQHINSTSNMKSSWTILFLFLCITIYFK